MKFNPEGEYGKLFFMSENSIELAAEVSKIMVKDLPAGTEYDVCGPIDDDEGHDGWVFAWRYPRAPKHNESPVKRMTT